MSDDKIKNSIIRAAFDTARALRDAAERLEAAACMNDFARLSETSLTTGVWSVDQIKGAALVIVRSEHEADLRSRRDRTDKTEGKPTGKP